MNNPKAKELKLLEDGLFVTELFEKMNKEAKDEYISTGVLKCIPIKNSILLQIVGEITKRPVKAIKQYLKLEYKSNKTKKTMKKKKYYATKTGKNIQIIYEFDQNQ